jgi:hypothetical protein
MPVYETGFGGCGPGLYAPQATGNSHCAPTGKGTFNGAPNADGTVAYKVEGAYSLP